MITNDPYGISNAVRPWDSLDAKKPIRRRKVNQRAINMTNEEAIAQIYGLKKYCEDMADSDESGSYVFDLDVQALDLALTALRPVSREQVEKVWRGQWVKCKHADYYVCNKCSTVSKTGEDDFCKSCGRAMTDEAVQMVMERLEALYEQ